MTPVIVSQASDPFGLVVSTTEGPFEVLGIYVKKFDDWLPIQPAPSGEYLLDRLPPLGGRVVPKQTEDGAVIWSFDWPSNGTIELYAAEEDSNHIFALNCGHSSTRPRPILQVELCFPPEVGRKKKGTHDRISWTQIRQGESWVVDGTMTVFVRCNGQNRTYAFGVASQISSDMIEVTLHRSKLIIATLQPESGGLYLILAPDWKSHRLGGSRTMSYVPSDFGIMLINPFPPAALLHFVAAMPADQNAPLSLRPQAHAQFHAPILLIADTNGLLLNSIALTDSLVARIARLLIVGNIAPLAFQEIVESGQYACVRVITTDQGQLASVIPDTVVRSSGSTLIQGWRHNNCDVGVTLLREWEQLEDSLAIVLNDVVNPKHELRQHWLNRLPPLPLCQDLAVGMVVLVGNVHRGRIPSFDDALLRVNYCAYENASLWLSGRAFSAKQDRSLLLHELVVRLVSEYVAIQAFLTWQLDTLCSAGNESTAPTCPSIRSLFETLFEAWQVWPTISEEQRNGCYEDARQLLRASPVSTEGGIRLMADIAYTVCSGDMQSTLALRSFINPLVLVFAAGEPPLDGRLVVDCAFWSHFAAYSSANKPGIVLPTFVDRSQIKRVLDLQRAVRLSLQDNDRLREASTQREELAAFLLNTLDPCTLPLIERFHPDRIVYFSDVQLDWLPFGDSLLGLEFPISRYPARDFAFVAVTQAFASPLDVGSQPAVCLLASCEPTDEVEQWAVEAASNIATLIESRFGWAIHRVFDGVRNGVSAVREIEQSQIVIFIGHAEIDVPAGVTMLSLGSTRRISSTEILEQDWSRKMAFLFGCETAAIDALQGNLAEGLLTRGCRAVVGTLAPIGMQVMKIFISYFLDLLLRGNPCDYSFFFARQAAFVWEALTAKYGNEHADEALASLPLGRPHIVTDFLSQHGVDMAEGAFKLAPDALSLTLLGGPNERIC